MDFNFTESSVVFGNQGQALYCFNHNTDDYKALEYWIKGNKNSISGIAHIHPYEGRAELSDTDKKLFMRMDIELKVKLKWPVITLTEVRTFYNYSYEEEDGFAPLNGGVNIEQGIIVWLRHISGHGPLNGLEIMDVDGAKSSPEEIVEAFTHFDKRKKTQQKINELEKLLSSLEDKDSCDHSAIAYDQHLDLEICIYCGIEGAMI